MNSRQIGALLGCALLFSLLTGCGGEGAQSYAAIGRVVAEGKIAAEIQQYLNRGYKATIFMTARTTPDMDDVVLQRRWVDASFPLDFGLGKARGDKMKKRHKELYLTALVELHSNQRNARKMSYIAWSRKPIKTGSEGLRLKVSHQRSDPSAKSLAGYPRGWWSPIAREEAVQPGFSNPAPGAFVFGGKVDIKPERARELAARLPVTLLARERPDRGFPELMRRIEMPTYPFRFALHQNHRMRAGGDDPVTDDKFVLARIDLDGNVETRDDAYVAVTTAKVKPGTRDLELTIDFSEVIKRFDELQAQQEKAAKNASANTAGTKPKDRGGLIAQGTVELPDALKAKVAPGSRMWLSVRDAKSNNLLLVVNPTSNPEFPFAFEIHENDGAMGAGVKAEAEVVVKAVVSPNPMATVDQGALIVVSKMTKPGVKNLKLELSNKHP